MGRSVEQREGGSGRQEEGEGNWLNHRVHYVQICIANPTIGKTSAQGTVLQLGTQTRKCGQADPLTPFQGPFFPVPVKPVQCLPPLGLLGVPLRTPGLPQPTDLCWFLSPWRKGPGLFCFLCAQHHPETVFVGLNTFLLSGQDHYRNTAALVSAEVTLKVGTYSRLKGHHTSML